jgi:hypothetical protein
LQYGLSGSRPCFARFDDVRDDVLAATGKRQQPYKYGSLPGSRDFFFVAGK